MMILLLCLALTGCGGAGDDNELTLQLRADFLAMEGCMGTADFTADYGRRVYEYTAQFSYDKTDGMEIILTAPEEVAGVTARIRQGQTALQFDGVMLDTGPLNADGLSPLDALPALFTAMQSGYIAETGEETFEGVPVLRICCRDPQRTPGQGLESILWFDKENKTLLRGEVRSDGATVVRCVFTAFALRGPTIEEKG